MHNERAGTRLPLLALGAALLLALLPARAGERWSAAEIAAVTGLGPWPPAPPSDPSNRHLHDPVAIAFGRALFFDVRLSRLGVISCAGCHKPEKSWTDGRIRASAAAGLDRNTPTLVDSGFRRHFGWDGGHDSLWSQSIRPILDPREMGSTAPDVSTLIENDPDYRAAHRALAGTAPEERSAEAVLVTAAKALAAFQATLISRRTAFDEARDRIAGGMEPGASGLSAAALRGLRLFVGTAGCIACHGGPHFTDDTFHAVLPLIPVQGRRLDNGRPDGLAHLAGSPFGRNGVYSDGPAGPGSTQPAPADPPSGAFRTPSLRGVVRTAPYLHDGRARALADAVTHGPAGRTLTPEAIQDLVEFLATLTADE